MNKEFADWIHVRCSEVIVKACMKHELWKWTKLGEFVLPTEKRPDLRENESILVSFYHSPDDWHVLTNFRTIGRNEGKNFEFESDQVKDYRAGNFKNDLEPKIERMKIELKGRKRFLIPYEAGYASMAPIHYFKYWTKNHKTWTKTFQLNQAQQSASHNERKRSS